MDNWYTELGPQGQLAVWLGASFLLYALAAQLAWQYRYVGRADLLGRWIDDLREQWYARFWVEGVRFAYFLGLPFLAAQSGLLGNDLLGLSGDDWDSQKNAMGFLFSDWLQGLGLVIAIGLAAWALLALASWAAGRVNLDLSESADPAEPFWYRSLNAIYDQIHWAFYRCGPLVWVDDAYHAIFAGLLIALVELALNPAIYHAIEARRVWIRLTAAWLNTLLFLATRNLWLSIMLHLLLVWFLQASRATDETSVPQIPALLTESSSQDLH